MGSIAVVDLPAFDGTRSDTGTNDVTFRRGFAAELAAGRQLIAQIGDLRIDSLDLATAKPDILEFKAGCDRRYANLMLPSQR